MMLITVSVPSRGILFPKEEIDADKNDELSFRPLSGYLISKRDNNFEGVNYEVLFPSPLGVSYFQKVNCIFENCITALLFPSPLGVSYFQKGGHKNVKKRLIGVSVPSRGILFPKLKRVLLYSLRLEVFPSPLGVSYFQKKI